MGLPPTQPVDHEPVVILQTDTAWDHDRIAYELRVIEDPSKADERGVSHWASRAEHPWTRYQTGETRWHLSDEVASYLRADDEPARFILRRLDWSKWLHVRGLMQRANASAGWAYALQHGLARVEGFEIKLRETDDGPISNKGMELLRRAVGDDGFEQLGWACVNVSRELAETEKKP